MGSRSDSKSWRDSELLLSGKCKLLPVRPWEGCEVTLQKGKRERDRQTQRNRNRSHLKEERWSETKKWEGSWGKKE